MLIRDDDMKLSDHDALIIWDLVASHRGCSIPSVINMLQFMFDKDITPAHYVAVGVAIGEMFAAEENVDETITNTNNG